MNNKSRMQVRFQTELWVAISVTLLIGRTMALGQADDPPTISSILPGANQVAVTVTASNWIKQLTLETRTNVAAGTWTRRAWRCVTNAGAHTLQFEPTGPREFVRACAYGTPSFLDRVTTGLGLITNGYPEAVLLEVDTWEPASGASTDPNDISRLRIVCRVNGGTALIESAEGLTFGPVDFVAAPWLGDYDISWPVALDVMEADILLKRAGYAGPFKTINLRQPVYPGMVEPYYIFGVTNVGFVFIGCNSKTNFVGH